MVHSLMPARVGVSYPKIDPPTLSRHPLYPGVPDFEILAYPDRKSGSMQARE